MKNLEKKSNLSLLSDISNNKKNSQFTSVRDSSSKIIFSSFHPKDQKNSFSLYSEKNLKRSYPLKKNYNNFNESTSTFKNPDYTIKNSFKPEIISDSNNKKFHSLKFVNYDFNKYKHTGKNVIKNDLKIGEKKKVKKYSKFSVRENKVDYKPRIFTYSQKNGKLVLKNDFKNFSGLENNYKSLNDKKFSGNNTGFSVIKKDEVKMGNPEVKYLNKKNSEVFIRKNKNLLNDIHKKGADCKFNTSVFENPNLELFNKKSNLLNSEITKKNQNIEKMKLLENSNFSNNKLFVNKNNTERVKFSNLENTKLFENKNKIEKRDFLDSANKKFLIKKDSEDEFKKKFRSRTSILSNNKSFLKNKFEKKEKKKVQFTSTNLMMKNKKKISKIKIENEIKNNEFENLDENKIDFEDINSLEEFPNGLFLEKSIEEIFKEKIVKKKEEKKKN